MVEMVNDAPALVTADVGIAMGAHGSTAASENADVVIMKDDLSKVAQVIAIAKHTMKIAKQSVLIGLFVLFSADGHCSNRCHPNFIRSYASRSC